VTAGRSTPAPRKPLRLGVLLSGSGRTLENLLRESKEGTLPATVEVVIADRPNIRGLEVAAQHGIPHHVVRPRDYDFSEEFSKAITYRLEEQPIDLVVMAGWLSFYKVPRNFERRVMNIHPALLPAFGGKGFYKQHVHEAVIKRGVKVSGCTVHFVNNRYDEGPIILQKILQVTADDTPDTLAARVFQLECEAYPEAIRLYADGKLLFEGSRIRILGRDPAPKAKA
jgi:phosphoribosylglycinamide formyltransferase-1